VGESAALTGRTGELAELERALRAARCQAPVLCLVTGEAGIGKSRLLSGFVERAARLGAATLVGGCLPVAEGELPFAPIIEAFRGVEGGLWLPDGAEVTVSSQPRIFERFLATLARLAARRPLVLAIEDLH
jgi:predicted ATPase